MPDHDADHPFDFGGAPATGALAHGGGAEHEDQYLTRAELRRRESGRSRSGDDHRGQRDRRGRRGRRGGVILVALVLVIVAAFAAFVALKPLVSGLTEPNDYEGNGSGSVTVTIASGASGRAIGRTLEKAGVVKSADAFVDAASENPKAGSIQPGQYTLRKHMSAAAAITMLLDPAARSADRVTIREGLRVTETVKLLAKSSGLPESDYTSALKDPQSLGLPAAAKGKAEGWLFPDTYEFGTKESAAKQLERMIAHTQGVLDELGVAAGDAQRVLTIASLVEAEGSSPEDFAKVARVIDNRLDNQLHNGKRLQLDSTVGYAIGRRTLTTTDNERAVDSPYNTYKYGGLPPGPIGNPGKAAIQAALHPADGPWLYFVTVNPSTGETKFATTSAEHQASVAQFRAWCQAHEGQC